MSTTRKNPVAQHLVGETIAMVTHEDGVIPGDGPVMVLVFKSGKCALLYQDPEGNPGGALHVVDKKGQQLGVVTAEWM